MKIVFILFFSIFLITCKEPTSTNNEKTTSDSNKISQQNDSITWIQNFRQFRDAVYQHNKTKVKSFIDFPINNGNNDIWYLVYEGNEKQSNQLTDKIKPFTETDFDTYFDKLFSKRFINSILKVKSDELNNKNETETVDLKDGNATTYKMYVTVDKSENTLTLHLFSDTVVKDDKGEIQDGGEFSIIYTFNIISNRQLKFKHVRLAG